MINDLAARIGWQWGGFLKINDPSRQVLLLFLFGTRDPPLPSHGPGTTSHHQETSENDNLVRNFFSRSPSSTSVGGKASDQPKRTPVSQEEIEAIMLLAIDVISVCASGLSDWRLYVSEFYEHLMIIGFMGDGPRGIQVFPDHFAVSTSASSSQPSQTSCDSDLRPHGHRLARRKLKNAFSILHLLTLRGLYRESGENGQEKVVLSPAEVKSLHSELAALDERESHCKAQLEHVNEILRSARLSGYLFLRTRWAALPGEPPPVDDAEVDDWLPRFVVLHGSCIYLYMMATDLSPQDSTRLSDIVEVGHLPCITREDEETQYCFYILTRQGLRYECATPSKIQERKGAKDRFVLCRSGAKTPNSVDHITSTKYRTLYSCGIIQEPSHKQVTL
ncbi:UNVERIFIED_CONTAM: hypothetical protein Scaly_0872700 [Sesamum calycinum]|uniref:PH domain-containing protein n=1 Tax=Sesamum calycinum TaxID=2727403 RepID=A0AAW2QVT7_9LAMI